jgi:hypothetical protein
MSTLKEMQCFSRFYHNALMPENNILLGITPHLTVTSAIRLISLTARPASPPSAIQSRAIQSKILYLRWHNLPSSPLTRSYRCCYPVDSGRLYRIASKSTSRSPRPSGSLSRFASDCEVFGLGDV